jgi:chemotaxis protein methyltransferase CheR
VVRRLTGIEMPEGRRADLERAAAQGLASTGAADADELVEMLESPSRAQPALRAMLPALTVGETHFFRNRPQMEALAREVLPAIIARRRSERRLRIWSAGCATGEEPYSVAMLIDGLLADRRDWDVRIVGTDLNPEALERARLGVYGSWSFREVPEPMMRTHFEPSASGKLELSPAIREMVSFSPLNIVTADYGALPLALTDLDLILCRNVLIYFRPEVVARRGAATRGGSSSPGDGSWWVMSSRRRTCSARSRSSIGRERSSTGEADRRSQRPSRLPNGRRARGRCPARAIERTGLRTVRVVPRAGVTPTTTRDGWPATSDGAKRSSAANERSEPLP